MSTLCYTSDGRKTDPFDLDPDDIHLEDIAIRLARIHRWAASVPYTVAEHSVAAAVLVRDAGEDLSIQRWALLHDAAEAWLGDVPAPIKTGLGWTGAYTLSFDSAECDILGAVADRFGLKTDATFSARRYARSAVAVADQTLRAAEERYWFLPETLVDREELAARLDPYGLRIGHEAQARADLFAASGVPDPGPGDRRIADLFLAEALSLGIQ
ncbi:MAG: hypothetical protein GX547_16340 [Phycisphaerae bacterium]|nr:hypothetical protein [Phycisphaerae bacterium]